VEALAYDPAQAEGIAAASAPLPGGALELQFVGGGRQLREQAMPLLFRVKSETRPGRRPAAQGDRPDRAHRQGRGAAAGRAGESQRRRDGGVGARRARNASSLRRVSVAPLDAARVAAISGLKNGERVVTEGAGLLAQVR
jgi:hypothetical protein